MAEASEPSTATVRESLDVVVPRAQATAEILAERVKNRDAQLRRSFIRRGKSTKPTPLMHLLRGGRGGEVRLKLFLSLLWMGVAPPHEVSYPARTWASLIGLADPPGLGARRVNDALAWLQEEDFISVEAARGRPSIVTLLDESGSGKAYTLPGAQIKRLSASGRPWNRHVYDKVPVDLWTNGWLATMSGPAVACFLVLLSVPGQQPDAPKDRPGTWFSRSLLSERYDMSDDTRQRGMRALRLLGLVETRTEVLARTSADFQRARNLYRLRLDRLSQPLALPPPPPTSEVKDKPATVKRVRSAAKSSRA